VIIIVVFRNYLFNFFHPYGGGKKNGGSRDGKGVEKRKEVVKGNIERNEGKGNLEKEDKIIIIIDEETKPEKRSRNIINDSEDEEDIYNTRKRKN
jgi:hypothetical protein